MITNEMLLKEAIRMMGKAYAPYSGYTVGAALVALHEDGEEVLYLGCNIENASYTPTVCAERNAFFQAVSAGERRFQRIAVAGGRNGQVEGTFPPCGVCRQVMAEFCSGDFEILIAEDGEAQAYLSYTLNELLPKAFGPAFIRNP